MISLLKYQKDPYKLHFPIGLLAATVAALIWFFHQQQWIVFYPRNAHANLMFFGFLWSFICGFLMTAIPRMTKTDTANKIEIILSGLFVPAQLLLNLNNMIYQSANLFLAQVLFLIVFIVSRFVVRKQIPFEGFIFLPFALLSSIIAPIIHLLNIPISFSNIYLLSGQAFTLNLILGLGSRLVPMLTRVPSAISPETAGNNKKRLEFLALAITLNLSFVGEFLNVIQPSYQLRAFVCLFIAIKHFKILQKPMTRSYVGIGLRSAVWMLILGYTLLSFVSVENQAKWLGLQHLVFIAGFSLLTLMVATRVTLAHAGHSLDHEKSAKLLLPTIILFLTASILRLVLTLSIFPENYELQLLTAMVGFIAAIALWLWQLRKALFGNSCVDKC